MSRKNIRMALVAAIILLLVSPVLILEYILKPNLTEVKFTHGASAEGIPATASDITLAEREGFGWVRYVEGKMSEPDFRTWAAAKNLPVEERSYHALTTRDLFKELPRIASKNPDLADLRLSILDNALVFQRRAPNGAGITVAYDRETGRFHYQSSHR